MDESGSRPSGKIKKKKRVTIKDIAAQAEVSLRTVSLVLNDSGSISDATRKKVLSIARKLDYRPNLMARGLVSDQSYLFGVNLPYLDLSFVHTIIAGMERKCIELNYAVLLASTKFSDISFLDSDIPTIEKSLERLMYRQVDGIVCLPDRRAIKSYKEVIRQGIPIIQILRTIPELAIPSITVNNEQGMYRAVQYLLDRGHERIGFLTYRDPHFEEVADRYKGYVRAYTEGGRWTDFKRFVISCDLTFKGGYGAAKKILARNPGLSAIVAATDYAAMGAMRACVEMGKRIPEDISIVGYDNMEFTELQGYRTLTTVSQPKEQVGILAAEYLYRMAHGEKVTSAVLEPELILRESSV
ncbi:LacI family DNA-binding transcriptional regulator [Breznakiella homolactica]|uniref:LacI family DNA-binding transcriptional regulator n=1 Tax=Breznakiella homolactica TaxID=2798577 RepID=A0A7T7XQD3_9SPIR|nr:LacI family DNA-binding transcriptional regulator [Breznakiella homolactica]QQO10575.1 LacI family transcriptional regulator [Breznakiella homolactica]